MFPNVELVAWLASTAQHNEDYRHLDLIKQTSPRQSSIWLRSLVATVPADHSTAQSEKAGGSVLAVCTGYGGARGLKVPQKQPKRGRLWLNDGSCVRLRPTHKGHVWSYDFVQDRTHEGKVFRMLCIIDEFTRECPAIRVERRLNSRDVLDELGELFVRHGPPEHIRSDNGPKFIATALREWLGRLGTKTLVHRARQPLGERVLSRASTASFETNYWLGRSSMICVKPKRSSKAGGSTTTPTDLILRFAICLQLQ